jgi:hypothetical protein
MSKINLSKFPYPLILELTDEINGGRSVFRLLQDFGYYIEIGGKEYNILVPAGTLTDMASVPRLLWRVLNPTGGASRAAVIHDYLYRCGMAKYDINRAMADKIFLYAMKDLGIELWRRTAAYLGVRIGGGFSYNGGIDA